MSKTPGLTALREARGLSLRDLSPALGVSHEVLRRVESGLLQLSPEKKLAHAKALGLTETEYDRLYWKTVLRDSVARTAEARAALKKLEAPASKPARKVRKIA